MNHYNYLLPRIFLTPYILMKYHTNKSALNKFEDFKIDIEMF